MTTAGNDISTSPTTPLAEGVRYDITTRVYFGDLLKVVFDAYNKQRRMAPELELSTVGRVYVDIMHFDFQRPDNIPFSGEIVEIVDGKRLDDVPGVPVHGFFDGLGGGWLELTV